MHEAASEEFHSYVEALCSFGQAAPCPSPGNSTLGETTLPPFRAAVSPVGKEGAWVKCGHMTPAQDWDLSTRRLEPTCRSPGSILGGPGPSAASHFPRASSCPSKNPSSSLSFSQLKLVALLPRMAPLPQSELGGAGAICTAFWGHRQSDQQSPSPSLTSSPLTSSFQKNAMVYLWGDPHQALCGSGPLWASIFSSDTWTQ